MRALERASRDQNGEVRLYDAPMIEVRPYRAGDRAAVRHICYVTGFMGDPVDWQWRDEETFADMFSGYYTDREPESACVADDGGRVAGYLLGCTDTCRSLGYTKLVARKILRKGLPLRPGTAGFVWRAVLDVVRDRHVPADFLDDRWPAHLHIDLLAQARGSGVGRRLVNAWLGRCRELGLPGVHLGTMAENKRAIAFFEATGFRRHGEPERIPGFRDRAGGHVHGQLMVQDL